MLRSVQRLVSHGEVQRWIPRSSRSDRTGQRLPSHLRRSRCGCSTSSPIAHGWATSCGWTVSGRTATTRWRDGGATSGSIGLPLKGCLRPMASARCRSTLARSSSAATAWAWSPRWTWWRRRATPLHRSITSAASGRTFPAGPTIPSGCSSAPRGCCYASTATGWRRGCSTSWGRRSASPSPSMMSWSP